MDTLFSMALCITVALFFGFFAGILRTWLRKRLPCAKENQAGKPVAKMTYVMFFVLLVLAVGLLWTVYFLILGIANPAHNEYATNVSQLIVAVLTVFSIIMAFLEFWRKR